MISRSLQDDDISRDKEFFSAGISAALVRRMSGLIVSVYTKKPIWNHDENARKSTNTAMIMKQYTKVEF